MRVHFWGTRGSIAKPGKTTLRYGGNTSCVEVQAADGTLVVLDCGTGARELGSHLVASGQVSQGHLLIGHTHWDHIQGFPFFAPLFMPDNIWEIYAPGGRARQIEASLAGQMSYEYFPITLDAMHADVRLHDLTEGYFELGSIRITTHYLNHPALTLGYRLEADGASLVYATDYEPHSLYPLDASPTASPVHHEDRRHLRFIEGADLLIHDAQYTMAEFPAKAGWGHTPMERAVDYAMQTGVRQLALFHHDPDRHDEAIDQLCEQAKQRVAEAGSRLQILAAAEGQVIELSRSTPQVPSRIAPGASALLSIATRGTSTVLIVDDDPNMVMLLKATLQAEEVRIITASDGESAIPLALQEPPNLILLDMDLPGIDGLTVSRLIREHDNPHLRDTPILMLSGIMLEEADLVDAFSAGATDYLSKPFKPTLLRSRVRTWLSRTTHQRFEST
jgi:CheY-like chemotaxis protein/phosphoribosyl 1,2-cyclic phosphodiesterase